MPLPPHHHLQQFCSAMNTQPGIRIEIRKQDVKVSMKMLRPRDQVLWERWIVAVRREIVIGIYEEMSELCFVFDGMGGRLLLTIPRTGHNIPETIP